MNWDNLKIILEISRAGSLTAAAHILGMDQSTVGRRLTAIEQDLGAALFIRAKSGFVATEPGSAAVRHAQEIEATCDRLRDEVTASSSDAVGVVRLAGNSWTLRRLARLSLVSLVNAHPRLDVQMVHLPPPAPPRGEATVSVWFEAQPNSAEFTVPLGKIAYAIYRARTTDAGSKSWVRFHDDVADRPIIGRQFDRLAGADASVRVTAGDADILLAAVEGGAGLGLLPMCLAETSDQLVRVTTGAPDTERVLHMHLNPSTVDTRRVRATIDWLRASFSDCFGVSV